MATRFAAEPRRGALTDQARKLAWQLLGPPPEPKAAKKKGERTVRPRKAKDSNAIESAPTGSSAATGTVKQPEAPAGSILRYYREAKERHPGMVLLFRCGDLCELCAEDADLGAKLLGLTLTTRDRTLSMAGFPHHCLEAYLRKLLHAGLRVAICDEVEGHTAKTRREVTRIVSPGTG